jgi:hypothetical protein
MFAVPVTRVELLLGKKERPGAELSLDEIEELIAAIEGQTDTVVLAVTVDAAVSLTDSEEDIALLS